MPGSPNVSQLIPQAEPFIMVDTLLSYTENELTSSFTVPSDHIFTDSGVFAEAGMIENMAQTVALHTGYQFYIKNEEPPTGYLGAINKVEISRLPEVGETIETKIVILHEFNGVTLVSIEVFSEGEPLASGQMKTVIAGD